MPEWPLDGTDPYLFLKKITQGFEVNNHAKYGEVSREILDSANSP